MITRILSALRWWTAVLAAALVLTHLAVAALTDVRTVALGPVGLVWLVLGALGCGALLGLACGRAVVAAAVAGVIAIFALGLIYSAVAWQLIGRMYTSFLELGTSDAVSLYVLPRALLAAVSAPLPCILGAGAVPALLPERWRG